MPDAESQMDDSAKLLDDGSRTTTSLVPSRKTIAMIVGAGALFVSAATFSVSSKPATVVAGAMTTAEASADAPARVTADNVMAPLPRSDGSGENTAISATNEMITYHGGVSGTEYPWMDGLLVEPHLKTTFVTDVKSNWRVVHMDTGKSVKGAEATDTFVHVFTELGEYHVKRAPFNEASALEDETGKVWVKYVRREVRSLSPGSKQKLFAAWKVVIETKVEAAGKETYGGDFITMKKLQALHNNFAGALECDHLHDGMGFLPTHIQMSRLLEASLQSVDASVSLPYWEYTVDVEHIIAHHESNFEHWKDLEVFTDAFFGGTSEDTATVDRGTFASVDVVADPTYSEVINAYGLIRSPWNTLDTRKPVRYFGAGTNDVSRMSGKIMPTSSDMPTCGNLQTVLNGSRDLLTFTSTIAQQAHGPIHLVTGGVSGTPDLMTLVVDKMGLAASPPSYPEVWTGVSEFFILVSRALYRYKLLTVPDANTCAHGSSYSASGDKCVTTCDAKEVRASPMYDEFLAPMGFTKSYTEDALMAVLSYLCEGGVVYGDAGTSSAANDPSFYSLHGTVERYLQLQRLKGRFVNDPWPDRKKCVFVDNVHPFSQRCYGHYADDDLLFGPVDGETMTNMGYYKYLDPHVPKSTYVYDNFKWSHCEDVGVDINFAG